MCIKPRQDSRYQNGVIYKYHYKDNPDWFYVGQSINVTRRLGDHRRTCSPKEIVTEILEEYPCMNQRQLSRREQYYMDTLNPTLNSRPAYWGYPDFNVYSNQTLRNQDY